MARYLIAALLISILAGFFALQNAVPITVNFLLWKFEASLAVVLLLAFASGVLASLALLIPPMLKQRWAVSNQRKRIEELESGPQQNKPA